FSVDSAKLGYFVLNNAANNDTAIAVVAEIYDFLLVHRRLRCGPHTLNLIGQTLLWGNNQQAYDNAPKELSDETVNEYLAILRPLKLATKRLKGRGTYKRFGLLAKVIPVFETILSSYEERVESYSGVNYDEPSAPEDHIAINLRAAWAKANEYYIKLDDSPTYYAATSLYPAYKHYCDNA
ncbi:hypothetical protein TUN199_11416, partial [Pyrenophora tritici-repentis]